MITLISILISGILGFFVLPLSNRIIARYPGTWVDVICQKDDNNQKSNFNVKILSAVLFMLFALFISIHYPEISFFAEISSIIFIFFVASASVIDWKTNIIPDILTVPMILLSFLVSYDLPWIVGGATESAIAGILAYVLPILVGVLFYKKSKDAIGGGDLKLLALGGLWLGLTGFAIAVVISAILSGLYSYKYKRKQIPYAPFFLIGIIIYLII